MFARVAAALAGAAILWASSPAAAASQAAGAPQAATRPAAGTAAIEGTVTAGDTGKPLPRVRVILRSASLAQPRLVLTNDAGGFRFTSLPAGDYEVHARRSGYALPYAAAGPGRGVAVHVGDGEARRGVGLALQRAGTIPGRLLDEDGTPLAGAIVEAFSMRSGDGGALVPVASGITDDRGEFRLTGLPAGQYLVAARDPSYAAVGDETGALRYAPTYHPGVFTTAEAQPVTVAAGQDAARIEFRLQIVRPARVSGTIATPDRRPLLSGAVLLTLRDGLVNMPLRAEDVEFLPDGRFAVRNVPPGRYQIRARAEIDPQGVMWFSTFSITVEGRDLDRVAIQLAPGALVDGRVEFAGAKERWPAAAGLRARAPLADGSGFGDALTGVLQRDGAFRIRGLLSGAHYFALEGLPEPWAVNAVMWRGRNVLDQPTSVSEGDRLEDVRIVVQPNGGAVEGLVRDSAGRAASDLLVVTTAAPPAAGSPASPRFRTTRTGADGRFRLSGLPPGEYRIAAVVGVDELVAERREWLSRVGAAGSAVKLAPEGSTTLDLTALALEPPPGDSRLPVAAAR